MRPAPIRCLVGLAFAAQRLAVRQITLGVQALHDSFEPVGLPPRFEQACAQLLCQPAGERVEFMQAACEAGRRSAVAALPAANLLTKLGMC